MKREKANELYAKAFYSSENNEWILEFARLVEQETLQSVEYLLDDLHAPIWVADKIEELKNNLNKN